jgi:hypothetical protein
MTILDGWTIFSSGSYTMFVLKFVVIIFILFYFSPLHHPLWNLFQSWISSISFLLNCPFPSCNMDSLNWFCPLACMFVIRPHPLAWLHNDKFLRQTYRISVAPLLGIVVTLLLETTIQHQDFSSEWFMSVIIWVLMTELLQGRLGCRVTESVTKSVVWSTTFREGPLYLWKYWSSD